MKQSVTAHARPQILSIASGRVDEWCTHSWKWLSRLRTTILERVSRNQRVSTRTMRADQRLAIAQLLKVILHHTDLKSMKIGFLHAPTQTFVHLSLAFLAKKANLPIRRAQRALQWLYQSGYISGYRQSIFDESSSTYIHKPSIRYVNAKLLFDLGIKEFALHNARNRATKRQRKECFKQQYSFQQPTHKEVNNRRAITAQLATIINPVMPKQPKSKLPPSDAYLSKIKKLMTLFPNLSQNEARDMLPSPDCYS